MQLNTSLVPKPADQRARRNKPSAAAVVLPPEGRVGDPPAWPLGGVLPDRGLWAELWATPQAAFWERAGVGLCRIVARYVVLVGEACSDARLLAEVRQLEDRLGLNPLAMRRLGWEIASDEVQVKRTEPGGPRYDGLRAVSGAVAGA